LLGPSDKKQKEILNNTLHDKLLGRKHEVMLSAMKTGDIKYESIQMAREKLVAARNPNHDHFGGCSYLVASRTSAIPSAD
jgi:hypothetical protein